MNRSIEKGTIKVVWISDSDYIHSKMFESEVEAEKFSKDKKDYLTFRLVKQKNMEEFSWILLPYGRYNVYKFLLNQYKKGLLSRLLKGKITL